jgi:hypothetical protein
MLKEDFRQAVRDELRKVPVTQRKVWDSRQLSSWWFKTVNEKPWLTWEKYSGNDLWHQVQSMCNNMIGDEAL